MAIPQKDVYKRQVEGTLLTAGASVLLSAAARADVYKRQG